MAHRVFLVFDCLVVLGRAVVSLREHDLAELAADFNNIFNRSAFPERIQLLFSLLLEVFLNALACLSLHLMYLLEVIAYLLERAQMVIEVKLLHQLRHTTRAAYRCYTLIVFLLFYKHTSLHLSLNRTTNSQYINKYISRARGYEPEITR